MSKPQWSATRKPYWSATRKRWFVRQGSTQVNLGADKDAAFRKYEAMLAGTAAEVSARQVFDLFLEWCENHLKASTTANYRHWLESFPLPDGAVKPLHVTRWLDQKGYKGNTANLAIRSISRAFNWAVKQGLIEANPIKGIDRPPQTPRECYLEPEQFQQLLSAADPDFRDFLTVLRETGCRPQEIRAVEARHFDRKGSWVFPREESKGKRKQRVVVLTPTALEITERLTLKRPQGPLFLNRNGKPWTRFAVCGRFERLSQRLGFDVSAYVIRHTWVTDALLNGVDPLTVATLAGHSTIKMIWQVYQHLQLQQSHMRQAAEQAVRRQA